MATALANMGVNVSTALGPEMSQALAAQAGWSPGQPGMTAATQAAVEALGPAGLAGFAGQYGSSTQGVFSGPPETGPGVGIMVPMGMTGAEALEQANRDAAASMASADFAPATEGGQQFAEAQPSDFAPEGTQQFAEAAPSDFAAPSGGFDFAPTPTAQESGTALAGLFGDLAPGGGGMQMAAAEPAGGGGFTEGLLGDMWGGGAQQAYGPATAAITPSDVMADVGGGIYGGFAPSDLTQTQLAASNIYQGGPGSLAFMGAGGISPDPGTQQARTTEIAAQAAPPGGEPPVEGGAPTEPVVSEETMPEISAAQPESTTAEPQTSEEGAPREEGASREEGTPPEEGAPPAETETAPTTPEGIVTPETLEQTGGRGIQDLTIPELKAAIGEAQTPEEKSFLRETLNAAIGEAEARTRQPGGGFPTDPIAKQDQGHKGQAEIASEFVPAIAEARSVLADRLTSTPATTGPPGSTLLDRVAAIVQVEGEGNLARMTAIAESILNRVDQRWHGDVTVLDKSGPDLLTFFPEKNIGRGGAAGKEATQWEGRMAKVERDGASDDAKMAVGNALNGSNLARGAIGNESGNTRSGERAGGLFATVGGERFVGENARQYALDMNAGNPQMLPWNEAARASPQPVIPAAVPELPSGMDIESPFLTQLAPPSPEGGIHDYQPDISPAIPGEYVSPPSEGGVYDYTQPQLSPAAPGIELPPLDLSQYITPGQGPAPGWLAAQQTAGAGPYAPFAPSPIGGPGTILQPGQAFDPGANWPMPVFVPTTPGPAYPTTTVQREGGLPVVPGMPVSPMGGESLQPGQQAPGEPSTYEQQVAALMPQGYEQPSAPPSIADQISLLGLGGYEQAPSGVPGEVAQLTPEQIAAGINIPPSAGIAPPPEVERAPLGELVAAPPMTGGEAVPYPGIGGLPSGGYDPNAGAFNYPDGAQRAGVTTGEFPAAPTPASEPTEPLSPSDQEELLPPEEKAPGEILPGVSFVPLPPARPETTARGPEKIGVRVDPTSRAAGYMNPPASGVFDIRTGGFARTALEGAVNGIKSNPGYSTLPGNIRSYIESAPQRGTLDLNYLAPYLGKIATPEGIAESEKYGIYATHTPGPLVTTQLGPAGQAYEAARQQYMPAPSPGVDYPIEQAPRPPADIPQAAVQEMPSGMDIEFNPWANVLPPMTITGQPPPPADVSTLAPPWTVYSGGFPPGTFPPPSVPFPPGIHEIPGGPTPSPEAPRGPSTAPSERTPSAPNSGGVDAGQGTGTPGGAGYTGGAPQYGAPVDLSYFGGGVPAPATQMAQTGAQMLSSVAQAKSRYPNEIAQIAAAYGVNIDTAATIFMAQHGQIASRQFGGPLYAGQPSLVGEQGPEMFVPNQSGTVVPLPQPDLRRRADLPGSLAPMLPIPSDQQLYSIANTPTAISPELLAGSDYRPGSLAEPTNRYLRDRYIAGPIEIGNLVESGQLHIDPKAWERMLKMQTPSTRIEDRRAYDEYREEQERAGRGYRKSYK
jgi:hypothetical protein